MDQGRPGDTVEALHKQATQLKGRLISVKEIQGVSQCVGFLEGTVTLLFLESQSILMENGCPCPVQCYAQR